MSNKKIYVCPVCGAKFLQWPSQVKGTAYCSKKCYAKSLKGKEPHNKGKKKTIEKTCAECGAKMVGMPSYIKRRKFCSRECVAKSLSGDLERILKRYIVDPETGCWLWDGNKRNGYGRFKINGDRTRSAHRASYEFHIGEIPEGMVSDHLCRNPSCINPDHLEVVTLKENIRRGNQGSPEAMAKHWKTRRERQHENSKGNKH